MQIANQLDDESKLKIMKGALLALSSFVVVLLLLIGFGLGIDKALLTSFAAFITPILINGYRQYKKGE